MKQKSKVMKKICAWMLTIATVATAILPSSNLVFADEEINQSETKLQSEVKEPTTGTILLKLPKKGGSIDFKTNESDSKSVYVEDEKTFVRDNTDNTTQEVTIPENADYSYEIVAEIGTEVKLETKANEGYEIATYRILSDSGEEVKSETDKTALSSAYKETIQVEDTNQTLEIVFEETKQTPNENNSIDKENWFENTPELQEVTEKIKQYTAKLDPNVKKVSQTNNISSRAGHTMAAIETGIVTINCTTSGSDGGQIVKQWNEGRLGVDGIQAYCMDINISFRSGSATQHDMTNYISQERINYLALGEEYIRTRHPNLTTNQRYAIMQVWLWRSLDDWYGWGFANTHISNADIPTRIQADCFEGAFNYIDANLGKKVGHGYYYTNDAGGQPLGRFWTEAVPQKGSLNIQKTSGNNGVTSGNSSYSLKSLNLPFPE